MTGPDNQFQWNFEQYKWNSNSSSWVLTNLTGTFTVPVNFYQTGILTGTYEVNSFNEAFASSMNTLVLPQVKSYGILNF